MTELVVDALEAVDEPEGFLSVYTALIEAHLLYREAIEGVTVIESCEHIVGDTVVLELLEYCEHACRDAEAMERESTKGGRLQNAEEDRNCTEGDNAVSHFDVS